MNHLFHCKKNVPKNKQNIAINECIKTLPDNMTRHFLREQARNNES